LLTFSSPFRPSILSWNRWDAPHYLYIAEKGYTNIGDEANFIVFFPLYPAIVKFLTLFTANALAAGIVLSLVFFVLGCLVFYKLLAIDFPKKIVHQTILLISIFPTAFFFTTAYSESLFFLLLALAFYQARKRFWLAAGLAAGLATLTRPFGMLIAPTIFFEWLFAKHRKIFNLFFLILPTLIALGIYLWLNNQVYRDPFAFQKILASNWQKKFALPTTGIWESWKFALNHQFTNEAIMIGWVEAISITVAWLALPFVFKKLRPAWAIYYLLSVVLFSSTRFILSTPRYFLSVPFLFVLLASSLQKRPTLKLVWRLTSIILLLYFAYIFVLGRWAF
jgi:Gpi18-like mannosyltransferase